MEEKTSVSFVAFESMKATMERTIKRLWILAIILVLLLFGSNAGWIYYESLWVDESVTQEVDTGDGAAFVAGIGDINYGESETNGEAKNP